MVQRREFKYKLIQNYDVFTITIVTNIYIYNDSKSKGNYILLLVYLLFIPSKSVIKIL